ncbi:MAG: NADH-quinone oxidoreductase subunit C [Candidatus Hydrothermales bacterium]
MSELINLIQAKFKEDKVDIKIELKDIVTLNVKKEDLINVIKKLKNSEELLFDYLVDITACDYLEKGHFEIIYTLLSFARNERVRVKTTVEREKPEINSITSIYKGANWFEREVYDLFGIVFIDHPNLKRILLWEKFPGYPLRKDFPMDKDVSPPEIEDIY